MKEIVRTLLIEAQYSNRQAIIPPLFSDAGHNAGRTGLLKWADYYDFESIPHTELTCSSPRGLRQFLGDFDYEKWSQKMLDRSPIDSSKNLLVRTFPDSRIFGQWLTPDTRAGLPQFSDETFVARYPQRVIQLANEAIAEMDPIAGALHVRRGDLDGPEVSAGRVAAHLTSRHVPVDAHIFLMTNPTRKSFADELRQHFPNAKCEFEIPVFQRLLEIDRDNYLSFRVSSYIREKLTKDYGSLRGSHQIPPPRPNLLQRAKTAFNRRLLWLDFDKI